MAKSWRSLRSEGAATTPWHACARSGFLPKEQGGHSNFPKSGVGQGPTSLMYQSVKDGVERARRGFCRITTLNPQSVGLQGGLCLAAHGCMWVQIGRDCMYTFYLFTGVSISLVTDTVWWLFTLLFFNISTSPHLVEMHEQGCFAQEHINTESKILPLKGAQ